MKCWYCKETEMQLAPSLGKDWLKCPVCGATHNELPRRFGSKRKKKK